MEGRYLIHDGDVTELDPNDFKQIAKLRLFLLNDSILIARQNEDIKGGSLMIFTKVGWVSPMIIWSEFRRTASKSVKSEISEKQN